MDFSLHWNGLCPESLLAGKEVKMRLNRHDFFESKETGLQICLILGVQAIILNFRGSGNFKVNEVLGEDEHQMEMLSPQTSDSPPFNNPIQCFKSIEELQTYITAI